MEHERPGEALIVIIVAASIWAWRLRSRLALGAWFIVPLGKSLGRVVLRCAEAVVPRRERDVEGLNVKSAILLPGPEALVGQVHELGILVELERASDAAYQVLDVWKRHIARSCRS